MSNWQPARPADLPTDQQNLLREVREALGDLDHDHDDRGPAVLAPGTDGHLRMILGPTGDDDSREVADKVAARLADAGLRLTADPERLAQGYAVKVARRGGRPEVGRPIMIRFPEELLARVDARAAAAGTNRAAAIRDLVTTALDQTEREATMTITATAKVPTERFTEGQQVALFRRTTVSPQGSAEDWYIADAGQALDGPNRPAWGDPAGYTVQWTGWGVGTVRAVHERSRDLIEYEVAEGTDYGTLTDYVTGEAIRPATEREHYLSSREQAGPTGVFVGDEPGRAVFVAGGPES